MANLIEIVFEQVRANCVMPFFLKLINCAESVAEIQCSEQLELWNNNELSEDILEKLIVLDGDVCMSVNVNIMRLGELIFPNVQIRLVKYGIEFDIDFNFDSDAMGNISTTTLINCLYKNTQKLAATFDVVSYYCGMDPASDEDTRYFTEKKLGPLI
jgi:hypothetical protein